jgi:glycosyltransferase involved in cell wall biosynthesis
MGFSIAMLSTYPPAQCGIATFAQALSNHLLDQGGDLSIVRVEQNHNVEWLLNEPTLVPGDFDSMMRVAQFLNLHDVVVVQHEYGIYGGADGEDLIDLLRHVRRPIISVLHTVLTNPTPHQHLVMRQLTNRSNALVTMTQTAKDRLIEGWQVNPDDVTVIPHGALDYRTLTPIIRPEEHRPVLLTWGLLGEGKGIEWAIRALAGLRDLSPLPRYRVVGQTHPRVRERRGEIYRERLTALAEAMDVVDLVEFEDRYLPASEIAAELANADVIVLPYDSREQVTSGVLTEAIAAGKPVISTAFPHAVELLSDGSGVLVPQGDAAALRAAMRRVLTDAEFTDGLAKVAHSQADSLLWPNIARKYLTLSRNVAGTVDLRDRKMVLSRKPEIQHTVAAANRRIPRTQARMELDADTLLDEQPKVVMDDPAPRHTFEHLFRLTTPLGIFEHCLGIQPRIDHGYCLDDAARALTLTIRADQDPAVNILMRTYFAFVVSAISDDGRMHNRRASDGRWTDQPTVGDHWGRAIRALGSVAVATNDDELRYDSVDAVRRALVARTPWLRSMAGAVVGCADVVKVDPTSKEALAYLRETRQYFTFKPRSDVWPWPEPRLSYGNAQIPEAMLAMGTALEDGALITQGLDLLTWLVSEESTSEWLSVVPVGGRGPGDPKPAFDQQPIEVSTLAEACSRAYELTGESQWADVMAQSAAWFLGANDTGLPVFNLTTGGGHDGLERTSVNANQGAESTIAALSTFQCADRLSVWSRK